MTMTVSPLPALSTRFGLVSALPTVVLVSWVAFVWGSGAALGAPDVQGVLATLGTATVAQVTIAGILGVALGSALHPFQFLLVRVLEGYWSDIPALRHLQYLGIEISRRRMQRLRRARQTSELLVRYPPNQADLLPTAIGNAMRAAERRAGQAYGMDAVQMLDRLYPLASPAVAAVFEDRRNQLDIAARYCGVLGLISISGLATLATDGAWLLLPLSTALLTWLSYRATLRTALAYGQGLRLIFDLHHADLVHRLGWRVPADPTRLAELGRSLQEWLEGGDNPPDPPTGYLGPAASSADVAGAEASAKVPAEFAKAVFDAVVKAAMAAEDAAPAAGAPDAAGSPGAAASGTSPPAGPAPRGPDTA